MREFSYKKELPFARIVRSSPISQKLLKSLREGYRINKQLFGRDTPRFKVVVCDKPSDWKRASKYYYSPFANGLVLRDGSMIVKAPGYSRLSPTDYQAVLTHEINHVFWCDLHQNTSTKWNPFWLVEGLACHVGKNPYLLKKEILVRKLRRKSSNENRLPYRYRSAIISSRKALVLHYSLWSHFVSELMAPSRQPMIEVIEEHAKMPGKAVFSDIFADRFGENLEHRFSAFLHTLQS